jgi:HlyD family secretion protein
VSALGVEEQRVNVIVDFLDPTKAQALGDGYRVDARIVVYRASDAVLVPTGAIFRDGPGYAVFVIDGGHARKRSIDVPRRNARQAVVVSGLNSGERVVAFPGDTVADGVRVEVRAPASR